MVEKPNQGFSAERSQLSFLMNSRSFQSFNGLIGTPAISASFATGGAYSFSLRSKITIFGHPILICPSSVKQKIAMDGEIFSSAVQLENTQPNQRLRPQFEVVF